MRRIEVKKENFQYYFSETVLASCHGFNGKNRLLMVTYPIADQTWYEIFDGELFVDRAETFQEALEIYNSL